METTVSVIMPAYNSEKYIRSAIESVLVQNVPLELIIIDDCSTDSTGEVVRQIMLEKSMQDNKKPIYYIKNDKNIGAAASRNKGVKLAKGKYIAFLDSDDKWTSGKLKFQLDLLEKNNMVLCSTARRLMNPDGSLTEKIIPVPEHITYRKLLKQNVINCSSVLVRKEAMLKYPMEHEDSHEDYISWLKILAEYKEACAINEPMLVYRLSNSGKSGSKLNSAKMTYKVYQYMGFGKVKSVMCFIAYAFNGVKKYYL